jgi:hypothetical protein
LPITTPHASSLADVLIISCQRHINRRVGRMRGDAIQIKTHNNQRGRVDYPATNSTPNASFSDDAPLVSCSLSVNFNTNNNNNNNGATTTKRRSCSIQQSTKIRFSISLWLSTMAAFLFYSPIIFCRHHTHNFLKSLLN